MNIFGLGGAELVVIIVIMLVVAGPTRMVSWAYIKGEKKKETDKGKSYRDETWSGSFQRTISLPEIVDPNKVDASMKDGVLSISLAKMEDKKPKQIEVKVK